MKESLFKEIDPEGYETLRVISEAGNFNRWMYEAISPYCTGRILEIGSGIGNISGFFLEEGRNLVLSDIRPSYCKFLREKFRLNDDHLIPNLDLVDPDFDMKYRHRLGTFDTVFALNVVEHIEEDGVAIRNCNRLLRPGGTLVILVPAYSFLYNGFDRELGHYRRHSKVTLRRLFQANHFTILKSWYFNLAGIPGWFVSGRLQKNKTIPGGQMKLYNKLVPLFRVLDAVTFNTAGLSVITVGKKDPD